MKVLAVCNRKGGTSKTTVAVNLAVCATEAGHRVAVIDIDRQASAVSWARARQKPTPLVAGSSPGGLEEVIDGFRLDGYDLAVIDTPGAIGAIVEPAMVACDFAIIPAQPTRLDLEASLATARALYRLQKPFAYVLTRCPISPQRTNEAKDVLERIGGLAGQPICSRLDFQDADVEGRGVVEYNRFGRAAAEVNALWRWMADVLKLEAANGAFAAQ